MAQLGPLLQCLRRPQSGCVSSEGSTGEGSASGLLWVLARSRSVWAFGPRTSPQFLAGCWLEAAFRSLLHGPLYMAAAVVRSSKRESANKMEVTCFCNLIMDLTSWLFFAGLKQGKGLFCTRKEEIVPECKDQEVWGSLGATLESAHPKMFPPHTFTYFFLLNVWSLSSVALLHRSFVIVVSVYIPWLILLWLNVSKTFLM